MIATKILSFHSKMVRLKAKIIDTFNEQYLQVSIPKWFD